MILRLLHPLLFTAGLGAADIGQARTPVCQPAFEDFPENVRARVRTAYDDAIESPGDASRVGDLAMLLHAHEQLRSAEMCYRRAQALQPVAFEWFYLEGLAASELGDHPRAVEVFRTALALAPDDVSARLRLAEALLHSGSLAASHDEYSRLVQRAPELALAHYGLGRVSALRGDARSAAAHYRRALELVPQFGAAHYGLALASRDAGDSELARKHLEAYKTFGPSRPALPDPLRDRVLSLSATGRDLLAEAARLAAAGRLEESIAVHLKAIAADPGVAAQAHVNLISLYGRAGGVREAEQHYHAAVSLGTSLVDAHYNYGVLLASTQRTREAESMFRRVLELNPFHAPSHNNLATLLASQQQMEQAVSHYVQAIAVDPQHRAARFNLGRTLVALGRPAEAIPHFERNLEGGDRDAATLLFALATAWLAANDRDQAGDYAARARRKAKSEGNTQLAARIDDFVRRLRDES